MGSYFSQMVQIILTDRGTEFSGVEEMEALGAKVFYCDPQCAWQKGHVEEYTSTASLGASKEDKLNTAWIRNPK